MLRVLLQRVRPMTLRTFVQLVSLMPILGALVCHGIAQADPSDSTDSWQVVLAAGDDARRRPHRARFRYARPAQKPMSAADATTGVRPTIGLRALIGRLRHVRELGLVLALLLICAAALTLQAQATLGSATIGGTVRDASGAAVPEAKVVLTETARGLSREATTNSAGSFLFPSVAPGVYFLRVTKEAFDVYLAALAPHGAIAVHISNRYFDLSPVLANIADAEGIVAYERVDDGLVGGRHIPGLSSSDWIVVARDPRDLGRLAGDPRWHRIAGDSGNRLWTDDYSSEIRVLRPLL